MKMMRKGRKGERRETEEVKKGEDREKEQMMKFKGEEEDEKRVRGEAKGAQKMKDRFKRISSLTTFFRHRFMLVVITWRKTDIYITT